MRRARMDPREAGFRQARALRLLGRLPIGIERKLGPTLDLIPFAPDDAARMAGRPVARPVDTIGAGLVPQGFATGFLVGQDLLLTNHHVFPDASGAVGTDANFRFEETSRGVQAGSVLELEPSRFFLSEAALDFALVAAKPRATDGLDLAALGSLALIEATPKLLWSAVNMDYDPARKTKRPGGRSDPAYRGREGPWGAFENHFQRSLVGEDTRAKNLAGPVQDPLCFWKVVVVPEGPHGGPRRLRVHGFLLCQRDVAEECGIEAFRPDRFRRYRKPLTATEAATGVVFAPSLHAADTQAHAPAAAAAAAAAAGAATGSASGGAP